MQQNSSFNPFPSSSFNFPQTSNQQGSIGRGWTAGGRRGGRGGATGGRFQAFHPMGSTMDTETALIPENISFSCRVCSQSFPTKILLTAHLKTEGHFDTTLLSENPYAANLQASNFNSKPFGLYTNPRIAAGNGGPQSIDISDEVDPDAPTKQQLSATTQFQNNISQQSVPFMSKSARKLQSSMDRRNTSFGAPVEETTNTSNDEQYINPFMSIRQKTTRSLSNQEITYNKINNNNNHLEESKIESKNTWFSTNTVIGNDTNSILNTPFGNDIKNNNKNNMTTWTADNNHPITATTSNNNTNNTTSLSGHNMGMNIDTRNLSYPETKLSMEFAARGRDPFQTPAAVDAVKIGGKVPLTAGDRRKLRSLEQLKADSSSNANTYSINTIMEQSTMPEPVDAALPPSFSFPVSAPPHTGRNITAATSSTQNTTSSLVPGIISESSKDMAFMHTGNVIDPKLHKAEFSMTSSQGMISTIE